MTVERATIPQSTGLAESTVTAWSHARFLNAEERATARLVEFFREAHDELSTFIQSGDLTASDDVFYKRLQAEVARREVTTIRGAAEWLNGTIPQAYVEGARTHAADDFSFGAIHDDAVRALSRSTLDLITATSVEMRLAVQQQIAQGILQGLPSSEVRARILKTGLQNVPRWPSVEYRAGVIARTETMRAYNAGSIAGIESTGAMFVKWIASPDEATCSICGPRDRKLFRVREPITGEVDPYGPAIGRLPKLPAHPRCRCTVRAWYRDQSGEVIDDGVPEPSHPPAGVAVAQPTKPPPAAGDIDAAIGKNGDRLKQLRQSYEGNVSRHPDLRVATLSQAERRAAYERIVKEWRLKDPDANYWYTAKLDDAALGKIAKAGKTVADRTVAIDAFAKARYGASFFPDRGMTPSMTLQALRGIEAYRSRVGRFFSDSPYFTVLGSGPQGARRMNNSGECFASGHIRFGATERTRPSPSHAREVDLDGTRENGEHYVALHEFAHSVHNRFGLHRRIGYHPVEFDDYSPAYGSPSFDAWHNEWRAIRAATKGGIAPSKATGSPGVLSIEESIRLARSRIESLKMTLGDLEARANRQYETNARILGAEEAEKLRRALLGTRPSIERDIVNTETRIRNLEGSLAATKAKVAEQLADPTIEHWPTNYAKKNEAEDFAESLATYIANPKRLRRYSPRRYAFMRDRVMEGNEYQ